LDLSVHLSSDLIPIPLEEYSLSIAYKIITAVATYPDYMPGEAALT
jgi:hypothetical protein